MRDPTPSSDIDSRPLGSSGKPRVLYIAGFGRSGTTIIEKAIAQIQGVVSVGELHYLWERGVVSDWICGCGLRHSQCGFWRDVFERMPPDARDAAKVLRLQDATVRLRRYPSLRVGLASDAAAAYGRVLVSTYRAIAETSHAQIVLDSSKIVSQAFIALTTGDVDMHVLHVVRDPRAVAHSWSRLKVKSVGSSEYFRQWSPKTSSLMWLTTNALVEATLRRKVGDHYKCVRYEDFVSRPRSMLRDIVEWLGLRDSLSFFRDDHTVVLADTHTVSGNPSRFNSGPVTIASDDAWRSQMPALRKLEASVAAAPLLRHYGY